MGQKILDLWLGQRVALFRMNTDNINILRDIFIALGRIDTFNIILPLHPRTAKVINSNIDIQNILSNKKNIKITEPLGFLDIMALENLLKEYKEKGKVLE